MYVDLVLANYGKYLGNYEITWIHHIFLLPQSVIKLFSGKSGYV